MIAIGCANNNGKSKPDSKIDVETKYTADINRAQQVFYALPSPVETAYLIQSTGVSYNMDLANPVEILHRNALLEQ